MKYASTKAYGGQRASIGRAVVVNTEENGFGAGVIDGIAIDGTGDTSTEEVWICEVADDAGGCIADLTFHATSTEAEIESMPVGCWTWPVRV